ncbi:type I restriction-modification system endonuclease [Lichenibacterium dinghuense]|uniref:type I restriction-modification system endonuclease n=1 Tax=Lichenibacterium dinghuense TaxID=2895977 RepID=UPI001F3E7CBE|nr:type I restriction-modification system endonuclease [Lichenibacterium sp. 6Y81]
MEAVATANFDFLRPHDLNLVRLGGLAERYFRDDPSTALFKLRQFAEILAKLIAAHHAVYLGEREGLDDLLRRLAYERIIPREVASVFHVLRKVGNAAAHEAKGGHAEALSALKFARELGIWFHRAYAKEPNFRAGVFVPPPEPVDATATLRAEIAALQQRLTDSEGEVALAQQRANAEARERESLSERLAREAVERALWEQLAQESEAAKVEIAARLASLQTQAEQAPRAEVLDLVTRSEAAAQHIDLDEADTRTLIDAQLRNRGWEADTRSLRHSAGTRPVKGRNLAIAEWPTANGPADYAFFVGTTLVSLVEAKRRRRSVSAAIDQAEGYARGLTGIEGSSLVPGAPWGDGLAVPFVFAANGRPYLRQLETASGIWFRDTRRPTNLRRALTDWPTPDGLVSRLEVDEDAASTALAHQPMEFGFALRPYQRAAIHAVEAALVEGRRAMLVAMATGTGKTKLAIALLYRLLAAKRFRRVCFVVDRSALGDQTEGEFSTTKVVGAKTFADTFGLKGLGDVQPDDSTRVHICTIQGLVRRVLLATDPADIPPVDQYDLLVVDECHRGYLLDRELSEAELTFRGQEDYVSKYRRVLDHFDAVKIGLTATPALHTTEIFGEPIFRYGYRAAVIDGYLNDHEPPIRIETALARAGIHFGKADQYELLNTTTGEIDLAHAPDELRFEVEQFNRAVVTEPFNRAVAEELTRHIDPALPGKTLIFAASDLHADLVVTCIKDAMRDAYGEIDDGAVKKITAKTSDNPREVRKLIRSFRNDASPKIAVTVDLLTTGVDVPAITNLVFLRRVNSRILYDQMIGRATRLCPEIGKEAFRVFDAVDLYRHLQDLTDMKPVVVNPAISFEQLLAELGRAETQEQRDAIRGQLVVKLRRRLKHLPEAARERVAALAGEASEALLARLHGASGEDLVTWARQSAALGPVLDGEGEGGLPVLVPISTHPDAVVAVSRGYGPGQQRPEDFLDGFIAFVRGNVNTIAALTVVVQRPRDLTRAQLRELRAELDGRGFSEASLKRAWTDAKNEEIAASIIGFVRQAALGDPLVPYADRVRTAMNRILASRPWTEPQRKWLRRIGEQVAAEIVVDRDALDSGQFQADGGGFARLNRVFSGELERVLADVNEELWKQAG